MSHRSENPNAPLVLVVDDDPDILELMSEALVGQGYRVTTAKHGEEALERVAAEEPRVILLDMRMPVMDGWTFARVLRERHGRSIPLVVVTAAENSELRASEVGAERHLGKPFELDELYGVVKEAVAA